MSNPDLDRNSLLGGRTVQFNVSTSTPRYSDSPSPAAAVDAKLPGHHNSVPHYHESWHRELFDVGIFKDTILPSLSLHGSLALVAYGIGRATNSVEAKDFLWPAAPIANAWWSAVGRKVQRGLTLGQALTLLSRPERLLLTGVTLWGGRLLYRISSRSARRRKSGKGTDDARYEEAKKEDGFWNKALFTIFIPEALVQTIITLPFTAPFHHQGKVLSGYHPIIQSVAVGLFSAGLALEILADSQLAAYKETTNDEHAVYKEGVWSLVRHPNYLGDALVHFSFPLLLYGSDLLAPIEILGSIANYLFLRYVGGDKQTEAHQHRRYSQSSHEKHADFERFKASHNSFWPKADVLTNQWLWIVLGAGAAGAAVEQVINQLI
ncbi:putative Steroid 5-alpha reductase C-terminal domain-containing protein [Seiridium unicorne]|uniref:Steroid 5-alpha reductase C-terminal domain-containing protein n=1 Tax=Seiridium unicorne TaxID=138068 RepID=A0ABR2UI99_9PEZI